MGINLSLPEIRKIVFTTSVAYAKGFTEGQTIQAAEHARTQALAAVLRELHLPGLASEIEKETTTVKGD